MSIVQWLLLILVIAVVAGAYWYLRSQADNDPWQDMDELDETPVDESAERGESLNGDSYVVGVRTLSKDTPASRKAVARGEPRPAAGNGSPRSVFEDDAEPAPRREPRPATDDRPPEARPAAEDAPRIDAPASPFPEVDPAPGTGSIEPEIDVPREPPPSDPETRRSARDQRADASEATDAAAQEDESAAEPRPDAPSTESVRGASRVDIRPQTPPTGEQRIFLLYVASADGRLFTGPSIHAALESQNLKFGLNDVFHRVTEVHGVAESVFGVANMLKPGTLDPDDENELATPGLTLFLVVPGPLEGKAAMRDMMETANGLASALGGEVLDDKRTRLKAQSAQYMLDQIAELDRRAQLASRR